MIWFNLKVSPD